MKKLYEMLLFLLLLIAVHVPLMIWADVAIPSTFNAAITVSLLAGSAAAMLLIFAYFRLIKPIKALTEDMNQISTGDLNVDVGRGMLEATGEVGDLTRSFSRLLASLKLAMKKTAPELENVIAEKEQYEKALTRSEQQYKALFDESPLMCFTIDPEGNVLSVNRKAIEDLGYSRDELVGESVVKVFHPDDAERALANVANALKKPSETHTWELRKVTKKGDLLWVRENVRVMKDTDGETIIYILCENITGLRK